jgi:hypothetical protein
MGACRSDAEIDPSFGARYVLIRSFVMGMGVRMGMMRMVVVMVMVVVVVVMVMVVMVEGMTVVRFVVVVMGFDRGCTTAAYGAHRPLSSFDLDRLYPHFGTGRGL